MRTAVFFDRDGVLNEVVWRDGRPGSPRALDELVPAAGLDSLRRLRSRNILLLCITNQPDVSRGMLPSETNDALMRATIGFAGLDDAQCCVHDDPDGCSCRKPRPGMLADLAAKWDVDLSRSFVVGDSWRDTEAGRAAGARTILLNRSYNRGVAADFIVDGIEEAVTVIVAELEDRGMSFSEQYLEEARAILERLEPLAIERIAAQLAAVRDRGGRLFLCGVGGGAAHASHAAADFRKLADLEAYAVSDNVAELTARTNDEGWEASYAAYLRGSRLNEADAVLVLSVGGGDLERNVSPNLVRAVQYAKEVGATVLGIVGRDGGYTASVGDAVVVVPTVNPATITPHTEAFQAVVWHLLVSHPALQRARTKWESLEEGTPPVAASIATK